MARNTNNVLFSFNQAILSSKIPLVLRDRSKLMGSILKISKSSIKIIWACMLFAFMHGSHMSDRKKNTQLYICTRFTTQTSQKRSFFFNTFTGDENWILDNNVERNKLWCKWNNSSPTVVNIGHHPNTMMLCMYWGWKRID